MYRVVEMSSTFYAIKINLEKDIENIQTAVDEGDVILLCADLESLVDYDIDVEEIVIVAPE